MANPVIALYEYGVEITNESPVEKSDTVILAVAHEEFRRIDTSSFVAWETCYF